MKGTIWLVESHLKFVMRRLMNYSWVRMFTSVWPTGDGERGTYRNQPWVTDDGETYDFRLNYWCYIRMRTSYTRPTRGAWSIFLVQAHWSNSSHTTRYVASTHYHVSEPTTVFALTFRVSSGKTTNIDFKIFGMTRQGIYHA